MWPKNEYTGSDSRLVADYKASDGRTHRVIPTLVLYSNKRTPQAFQRLVLKAKAFFLGPFRVHKAIFHIQKESSDLPTTVDRPQNSNNGHLRLGCIAQPLTEIGHLARQSKSKPQQERQVRLNTKSQQDRS